MRKMKHPISKNCKKMIKSILKIKPEDRPTIKQILRSKYVAEMTKKFKWKLKKLMKFSPMSISSQSDRGTRRAPRKMSIADSLNLEKRVSDLTNTSRQKRSKNSDSPKKRDLSKKSNKIKRNREFGWNPQQIRKMKSLKEGRIQNKHVLTRKNTLHTPRAKLGWEPKMKVESGERDTAEGNSPSPALGVESDFDWNRTDRSDEPREVRILRRQSDETRLQRTDSEAVKVDSNDEINQNLDKMANIFGFNDDDENFGYIKKISEAITNKQTPRAVNWTSEHGKPVMSEQSGRDPENSSWDRRTKDSFFPINLSGIEMNHSMNENLISTERGRVVVEKKLQVLKGKSDGKSRLTTELEEEFNSDSKKSPLHSSGFLKQKLDEAFFNSDFYEMRKNLDSYQERTEKQRRLQRGDNSQARLFKDARRANRPNMSSKDIQQVLQTRDFNFDLDQNFLGSRPIAYQSKDYKYSMQQARKIEQKLRKLDLGKFGKNEHLIVLSLIARRAAGGPQSNQNSRAWRTEAKRVRQPKQKATPASVQMAKKQVD